MVQSRDSLTKRTPDVEQGTGGPENRPTEPTQSKNQTQVPDAHPSTEVVEETPRDIGARIREHYARGNKELSPP